MTDRELFSTAMADLGRGLGRDFATGEDTWTIPVFGGKVNVCLSYRAAVGLVYVIVPVTPLATKPFSMAARAWMVLEMNAFFKGTNGATIAADPETGMLTILDRRAVRYFPSAGAIGNYVTRIAEFARALRADIRHLEDAAEQAFEEGLEAEDAPAEGGVV